MRPSSACQARRVVSAAARRGLATAAPRPVLQSARVTDVAGPQDLKGGGAGVSESGGVLLVDKTLSYRALQTPEDGVRASLRHAMASSDEPLQHTEADAACFFSLERSRAFRSLFYHAGLCGRMRQERELKTAAAMVRREGLALRDELLWRAARSPDQPHSLCASSGLVLTGERGCGKSWTLNYAAAACEAAGWLVVLAPWAADWTLGVGARSAQAANEAYRVTDPEFFGTPPPELKGSELYDSPDASIGFLQAVRRAFDPSSPHSSIALTLFVLPPFLCRAFWGTPAGVAGVGALRFADTFIDSRAGLFLATGEVESSCHPRILTPLPHTPSRRFISRNGRS
jgi:hypothetical protein